MKKFIYIIACAILALAPGKSLKAQEITDTNQVNVVIRDSLVYIVSAAVDSSLVGQSILDILPSKSRGDAADIRLYQSNQVATSLRSFMERNSSRTMTGYRVRIFFDNKQNSRTASDKAMETFKKAYFGVPAYRSYQSPFFKVTVGDFRTKSEAMELLQSLKYLFPAAFIVKEPINYPAADREHLYIVDTIKVASPVPPETPVEIPAGTSVMEI